MAKSPIANSFDKNILKTIDLFSYKFFAVMTNPDIKCVCVRDGTSQPDPTCKKCLGLGFKIKIKEIEGASQESNIPATMRPGGKFLITKNYYIKEKIPLRADDLIVDDGEVYFVYEKLKMISFEGKFVYGKFSCIKKKLDTLMFLKNFNEIIGGV